MASAPCFAFSRSDNSMIHYPEFVKIKDKCCIFYKGPDIEYVSQLISILPHLEKHYKGLDIWIACREKLASKFHSPKLISLENLNRSKFGFCYELTTDRTKYPANGPVESDRIYKILFPNSEIIHSDA